MTTVHVSLNQKTLRVFDSPIPKLLIYLKDNLILIIEYSELSLPRLTTDPCYN